MHITPKIVIIAFSSATLFVAVSVSGAASGASDTDTAYTSAEVEETINITAPAAFNNIANLTPGGSEDYDSQLIEVDTTAANGYSLFVADEYDLIAMTQESEWNANGEPVSTATGNQKYPQTIADGDGGVFVTWQDERISSSNINIYAQRIDEYGSVHTGWAADGQPITTAINNQSSPQIVADGAGGAYITWADARIAGNTNIYAQRIDADGSIHSGWAADGQPVTAATGSQNLPKIVADGAGGALISWWDSRSAMDLYAQRIDADGSIHSGWDSDGQHVALVTSSVTPRFPIIANGASGAYMIWLDNRSGDYRVYIQHIDADGSKHSGWGANGECTVSTADGAQDPRIASDGAGGALVTWWDPRDGTGDVFAQRFDADGSIHSGWDADGQPVSEGYLYQIYPEIVADGAGGAYITFDDLRSGSNFDIYVQRIDADGSIHSGWDADGQSVSAVANKDQQLPQVELDGVGGVFITWYDYRSGSDPELYVQRIDAGGSIHSGWDADGQYVDSSLADGSHPLQIASDSAEGVFITWYDKRNGSSNTDIYVQRIDGDGDIAPSIFKFLDITFGSFATPAAWNGDGVGFSCEATGTTSVGGGECAASTGKWDDGSKFAPVTTNSSLVHTVSTPGQNDFTSVIIQAEASGSQISGQYVGELTFTAHANI